MRSINELTDTSAEAAAVQLEVYRRLGPSGRVAIAAELSAATRSIAISGIRRRNPGLTQAQALRELMRLLYGVPVDVT